MQFKTWLMVILGLSLHLHSYARAIPDLPEPVSNNAVAKVTTDSATYLVSFMGLGAAKDHNSVHNKVWSLKLGDKAWQPKSPVPSSLPLKGRLAGIAVSVGRFAYVFGGYTVAADHTEISSPDNFRYDPAVDRYTKTAPTPIPVDDTVALVYQQRYIYLVSGWHNDGNVNLVQVYDTQTDSWQQASPYLGKPVFGHAGAIINNNMLICDGVIVEPQLAKRRTFESEAACYLGVINPQTPSKIDWRVVDHPTSEGRYRMAAKASAQGQKMLFWGGSNNPYNYNGIGYNGIPSEPSSALWSFDLKSSQWQITHMPFATMDHRALVQINQNFMVIGGMLDSQEVSNKVIAFELSPVPESPNKEH